MHPDSPDRREHCWYIMATIFAFKVVLPVPGGPWAPADSTTTLGKHRQESLMAGFQLVFRPAVEIVIAVDELEEYLLPLLWVVARKVKEDSTAGESKFCPWLVLFQLCHCVALAQGQLDATDVAAKETGEILNLRCEVVLDHHNDLSVIGSDDGTRPLAETCLIGRRGSFGKWPSTAEVDHEAFFNIPTFPVVIASRKFEHHQISFRVFGDPGSQAFSSHVCKFTFSSQRLKIEGLAVSAQERGCGIRLLVCLAKPQKFVDW